MTPTQTTTRPPPEGAAVRLGDTAWRLRAEVEWLAVDPRSGRLLACDHHSVYMLHPDTGEVLAEDDYPADHLFVGHGKVLASSFSIKIYDARDLSELAEVQLGDEYPDHCALVDGGRLLVTGTGDGNLVAFDDASALVTKRELTDHMVHALVGGEDAVYAIADERVYLVDPQTLRERTHWSHSGDGPVAVALAPDGEQLAVGMKGGAVHLLDARHLEARAALPQVEQGPVRSLAFSRDGRTLAAGDEAGSVHVWSLAAGDHFKLTASSLPVRGLAFSLDDGSVFAGTGACIQHWDLEGRRLLNPISGHLGAVRAVAFGCDGSVATMSADSARIWDVGSWRSRSSRGASFGYGERFEGLAWAGDHYRVVLAVGDDSLRVQEMDRGRELLSVEQKHHGDWIGLSPDGQRMAWADPFYARVWSIPWRTDESPSRVDLGYCVSRAWQDDGQTLVVGSDNGRVTFLTSGRDIERRRFRRGRVRAVAASADGRVAMASPSYHRRTEIGVWDRQTGEELCAVAEETAHLLAFSGDGSVLAAAENDKVSLLDARQGTSLATWDTGDKRAEVLAFSPGERHLVAGLSGGTVVVWDLDQLQGPWSVGRWCRRLADHLRGHDRRRASPYRGAPPEQGGAAEVQLVNPGPRVVLGASAAAMGLEAWVTDEGFTLRVSDGADPPGRQKRTWWQWLVEQFARRREEPDFEGVRAQIRDAGLEPQRLTVESVGGRRVVTLQVAALPEVDTAARLMEALAPRP